MIRDLAYQRCFNHSQREAVARCPSCRRFFCRECITEHDDKVICANCLRALAPVPILERPGWARLLALGRCAMGLVIAWFFFYLVGSALLALPSSFHEGAFWQVKW